MNLSWYKLWIKFWYYCTKYKLFNFFWYYIKKLVIDPKWKKSLKLILDTDENLLIENYKTKKQNILNNVKAIKRWSNVFIPLLDWWAWDIAYRFIYLKEILYYLKSKWCVIYIISQEKFSDIIKLIYQYFDIIFISTENDKNRIDDVLKQDNVKTLISEKKWILINHYAYFANNWWMNLFKKTWNDKWNVFWYTKDFENFLNKNLNEWKKIVLNKKKYKYDNQKIKKVKDFKEIILCNYESKTFNMPCFDRVSFKKYLRKTHTLWKQFKTKFIINSVYNWEKNSEDKRVSVKWLSFQEVIYLADNNLIKIFISERNWLNDVLYVFFPNIKQIIYYPKGCWFLTKFNYEEFWLTENYDISLLNLWKLPKWNNIQDYRCNYNKTIEEYIKSFINQK